MPKIDSFPHPPLLIKDLQELNKEHFSKSATSITYRDCGDKIINENKDAIVVIDKKGIINIFNSEAERIFCHKKEDIQGKSLDILVPVEFRMLHRQYIQNYFSTGKPDGGINKTLTVTALRSDGTIFPVEVSLSGSNDTDNPFVIAIIRDISESKKKDEELKKCHKIIEELTRKNNETFTMVNEKLQLEITRRMKIEKQLRCRLLIEQLMSVITGHFVNLPASQIHKEIDWALKAIGDFAPVDRCFIDLYSDDLTLIEHTHEWCKQGVKPRSKRFKEVFLESLSCLFKKGRLLDYIYIPHKISCREGEEELPDFNSEMKSLFAIPMIVGHNFIGLTGFSLDKKGYLWKNEDINFFKLTGDFFLNLFERKRKDTEISETRNMIQSIVDAIPAKVFWKDKDSIYRGCNRLFAIDAGLKSTAEIAGKSDYDFSWGKDDAEFYRECDRQVMKMNKPEYHMMEPKPGTGMKKMEWIYTNRIPLHDCDGNITGVIGIYEDITEIKKAEQAVLHVITYRGNILNNLHIPAVIMDSNMRIISANNHFYRHFKLTPDKITGRILYNLDENLWNVPSLHNILEHVLEEKSYVENFQLIYNSSPEEKRTLLLNARKIFKEDNRQVLILIAVEDITEQKNILKEEENLVMELQSSLDYINSMKGLLPLCASCKNIRDDNGYWYRIEAYIESHSQAEFTHSICPECLQKDFPEYSGSES
ncbi:MAG: PAS domain S-box protein [Candidatus Eremiobacterota bacterium]